MTLKNGFGRYSLFDLSANGRKIKDQTWPLRFPAKENPNMEKALFDWPIMLQYDVKAKYRLISRKFLGMKYFLPERSLNQPKATRVCICSINQSNRSISIRLLFLYCPRVFISRSYESRSVFESATFSVRIKKFLRQPVSGCCLIHNFFFSDCLE